MNKQKEVAPEKYMVFFYQQRRDFTQEVMWAENLRNQSCQKN